MNSVLKTNDIFTIPRPQWILHKDIIGPSQWSPQLPRGGSNLIFTGLKRSKEIPHLHCLWWLPDQATCLCLLQRLRPSHPQCALVRELVAIRASFLVNSTSEKPGAIGLWKLQYCSADENSCLHQWQQQPRHFHSSFSSLNWCQVPVSAPPLLPFYPNENGLQTNKWSSYCVRPCNCQQHWD